MTNDQTSVPTSSPEVPVAIPPVSKSPKITPVAAVLILLGLVGGGAYAYYAGFFNFKKTETFEQVFTRFLDKIDSQKYGRGTVEGNITIKDKSLINELNLPADTYPQINFSYDAVFLREDLNDSSKDKLSINAKFNILNILKDPISAEVEYLMPEQMIFYVKLNELTGLPQEDFSLGVSLLQGRWWKFDIEALIKNFGGLEGDKMLELMKESQLSKEKIEQIQNILKKYISLAHVEKLADGAIDSASAYRWSINFEKKQFVDMFMEISEVTRIDSIDEIEIKTSDVRTSLEDALKAINIKPLELSFQKKGYIPTQIKFSLEILDDDGINIADVNIASTFSSSEPVTIKAPAESTDILYLMGPLVQSSLETARNKGKEAAIKANMSMLRPQAELFYDANRYSYSGFCASQELKDIRKSIENSGGTGFICRATGQKYAVGVNFPQKTSGSWCVDSTGASKAVATLPSSTVCLAK